MAYNVIKSRLEQMTSMDEVSNLFHDWKSKKGWQLKHQHDKNALHEVTFYRLEVKVRVRLSVREKKAAVSITYTKEKLS